MVYGRSSSHSLVIESGGLYYIHNLAEPIFHLGMLHKLFRSEERRVGKEC